MINGHDLHFNARGAVRNDQGKRRLAIIGNGMATCRLLDELCARGAENRFDITVYGEEPRGAYNRIQLGKVLGGKEPDAIITKPPAWYAERGITFQQGVAVARLDTARKRLETKDGQIVRYDVAVLATGSLPSVPPLPGMNNPDGSLLGGVFVYRTMDDCLRMRDRAQPGHSAVVLGGGLLGLESAKVLSDLGLHVSVVHSSATLMNSQLDPMAGEMLARQMERMGIFLRLGRTIETVEGDAETGISAVVLDDGRIMGADMLVLACGVRPRIDVARASGLPINRGIIVNDTLATEAPGVYAVGECAEHRDPTYGIVAPAWEQAVVLADVLSGVNPQARYRGSNIYTRLKVAGVEVATMGTMQPELDDDDVLEVVEQRKGTYRKLIMREGRLMGAMLVGNTDAAASLVQIFDREDLLPRDPLQALCDPGALAGTNAADRQVCNCHKVSEGQIRDLVAAGAVTFEAVAAACRAGTGCGSCRPEVERLVTLRAAQPAAVA